MGNAGAVGGLQFHQVMKPMGDQQQHQYTVVTTGGQPVVTTTASPSTVTTVLAPPPSTTTSQVSGSWVQTLLARSVLYGWHPTLFRFTV